ncbi:hypothetical protein [Serratia fonticola]|uniref:hypothetical protein n=1 Tax=Serratia fonticola TaxID=47917 RepID=UPI001F27E2A6|nr:hypothetical protein [Serratia fonticola]
MTMTDVYLKKPRSQYRWRGARVIAARGLSNQMASVPLGASGTVTYSSRGLTVRFDACACCGVQVQISGLRPEDLEITALPESALAAGIVAEDPQ